MLYIVPSRGRPHKAVELVDSWAKTRSGAHLWIGLDDDDPTLDAYLTQLDHAPSWVTVTVGKRLRLGGTLNELTTRAIASGRFDQIGFMGDDHRPRTPAWDQLLGDALKWSGPGVAYGNDLIQGANLPTAVLISEEVLSTLGYFCPPGMTHLFLDNAWKAIGEASNLTYRPDVIIEHVHPIAGKAEWDAGYVEANSGATWEADEKAYRSWMVDGVTLGGWQAKLRKLVSS